MKLPKPFLGRALIEVIDVDVEAYMKEKAGINKDSKLILSEAHFNKTMMQIKKGLILETANDWGMLIEAKYEASNREMGYFPTVGDIVWFIPNETYAVDMERKYHLINDCDVVAYERGEANVGA